MPAAAIQAPGLFSGATPMIVNTTRNTPLAVAAPGVVANSGPTQQFIGSGMSAVLVTPPANAASFQLDASGAFNYTPARDFVGTDSFSVLARRTCGGAPLSSSPATIYVYGECWVGSKTEAIPVSW